MKKRLLLLFAFTLCSCQHVTSSVTSNSSIDSNNSSNNSSAIDREYLDYNTYFSSEKIEDKNAYLDYENDYEIIKKNNNSQQKFEIYSLNDSHGALLSDDNTIGFDNVSSFFKENENNASLKLLVGDIFQGGYLSNMTKGDAFVDAINKIGFDAFVIGNHEFDWGLENIARLKDGNEENGELNIPILGANIYYKNTDLHPSFIDPYVVYEINSYKVGIIGVIGDDLESSISVNRVNNYEFRDSNRLIENYANILREKLLCDYVFVANHGYDEEQNNHLSTLEGNSLIDGIFCGHTHQVINYEITRSNALSFPVVQSGSGNEVISSLIIEEDNISANTYAPSINRDNEISKLLNDKYEDLIYEGKEELTTFNRSYSKSEILELLGKYWQRKYSLDCSIVNYGGVRDTIGIGKFLVQDALKIFPFDNELLVVKIDGASLQKMIREQNDYLYFHFDEIFNKNEEYEILVIDYVYSSNYYKEYLQNTKYSHTNTYILDDFMKAVI